MHVSRDQFYVHVKLAGMARVELAPPRFQSGCSATALRPDREVTPFFSGGVDYFSLPKERGRAGSLDVVASPMFGFLVWRDRN